MRLAVGVALVSLVVAGCTGKEPSPSAGENGGTLVISIGGDPDMLFPPLTETTSGQIIEDLVYDKLAEIGDSLNTVGDGGFQPSL
ncbi:MAG: hypothetical protein ABIZ36_12980, partial [Gemmatimonadaceae bacterium]